MQNMFVEDEEDDASLNNDYLFENQPRHVNIAPWVPLDFARFTTTMDSINNPLIAKQLSQDIMKHLW